MTEENLIIEEQERWFDHERNCLCNYCMSSFSENDDEFDDELANTPDCEMCGGEFWNGGTSCTCDEDYPEACPDCGRMEDWCECSI